MAERATGAAAAAGTPTLRLRFSVDPTDGRFAATPLYVAPDGSATAITRGHHNIRFREGLAQPKPIPPGETLETTLRFAPQNQTVGPGHIPRSGCSQRDVAIIERLAGLTDIKDSSREPIDSNAMTDPRVQGQSTSGSVWPLEWARTLGVQPAVSTHKIS